MQNENTTQKAAKDPSLSTIMLSKLKLPDFDEGKTALFSPDDLEMILAFTPNFCDKFLIRGFYEGLGGKSHEEFKGLTLDCFDAEKGEVHLPNGRTKRVSKELCEYAEHSAHTYIYYGLDKGEVKCRALSDIYAKGEIIKSAVKPTDADETLAWMRKIRGRMEMLSNHFDRWNLTVPMLRNSAMAWKMLSLKEEQKKDQASVPHSPEFESIMQQYNLEEKDRESLEKKFAKLI